MIIFAHHLSILDGIEEGLAAYRGHTKGKKSKSKVGERGKWMRIDGYPHSERTANAAFRQTLVAGWHLSA